MNKEDNTDCDNNNKPETLTTKCDDESLEKEILKKLENTETILKSNEIGTDFNYKHKIVWKNAISFLVLHVLGLMGFWVLVTGGVSFKTVLLLFLNLFIAGEGITVGAHRYFTHKCFKAKPLLEAILLLGQAVSGQNCAYIWARDHRLHHRYTDTDADPHNSKRGFFFSHIGWLMTKKHPYVKELGKRIDMSDLENNWMVMFQKKYYYFIFFTFTILLPVWIPVRYFGESFYNSFLVSYAFRHVYQLNATWLVNSAAHLWGTRPYDKDLQPVESWFVSFFSLGEGWHNYHHAFPWDYKAAELSMHFNISAKLIRWFERIGLAYDLKSVPTETVNNRILKKGDGTHFKLGTDEARSQVKAIGPLHPFNPSYTTKFKDPSVSLKQEGLPLFHENDVFDVQDNCVQRTVKSGG